MSSAAVRRSASRHSARSSAPSGAFTVIPAPKVDFMRLLEGKTRTPVTLQEYRDYLLTREYGAEVRPQPALDELASLACAHPFVCAHRPSTSGSRCST
jgi:hypothetical protein